MAIHDRKAYIYRPIALLHYPNLYYLRRKQMSNKQLRNYLILMVAVVVGVLALYYLMSPYQNCVRDIEADRASQFVRCMENTSW